MPSWTSKKTKKTVPCADGGFPRHLQKNGYFVWLTKPIEHPSSNQQAAYTARKR